VSDISFQRAARRDRAFVDPPAPGRPRSSSVVCTVSTPGRAHPLQRPPGRQIDLDRPAQRGSDSVTQEPRSSPTHLITCYSLIRPPRTPVPHMPAAAALRQSALARGTAVSNGQRRGRVRVWLEKSTACRSRVPCWRRPWGKKMCGVPFTTKPHNPSRAQSVLGSTRSPKRVSSVRSALRHRRDAITVLIAHRLSTILQPHRIYSWIAAASWRTARPRSLV